MSDKYEQLLSRIVTKSDSDLIQKEIDILLESLYEFDRNGADSILNSSVRSWVSGIVKESWGSTKSEAETYLKELKKTVADMDVVKLTLAWEPSTDALTKIYQKISSLLGHHVILDISHDRKTLGGINISYKGIYRDLSLRKLITESGEKINLEIEKHLSG